MKGKKKYPNELITQMDKFVCFLLPNMQRKKGNEGEDVERKRIYSKFVGLHVLTLAPQQQVCLIWWSVISHHFV